LVSPSRWTAALLLALAAAGTAHAQPPARPPLVALCVGISQHEDPALSGGVSHAAKDALDVAAQLRAQEGKLFGRVECLTLTDAQATLRGLEQALTWLRERARPDGYTIVFLAGHGGPDPLGQYVFVPHDAHALLASTHLPGRRLRDALQQLPGTRLLLLDTCHAGGFSGSGTDFVTVAACMAREVSGEGAALGNGYFSRSLVEALQGKADLNRDGLVTLAEADAYLAERLQELTGGRQRATMHRPASVPSRLPLAYFPPAAGAPARISAGAVTGGQSATNRR
jgi:hypothetical protein